MTRPAAEPPLLALTQGDPSGVGPDIALAAWLRRDRDSAPFYIIADPALLDRRARHLGLEVPLVEADPAAARGLFARALPVVSLDRPVAGRPGQPTPDDAPGTIEAIVRAVRHVRDGRAAAIVTNPIAKHVLYAAGFAHPGHTEFLAERAGVEWATPAPLPVMMLWSPMLAVVPITIHVPLSAVPGLLTAALMKRTATIVADDLRDKFGIAHPRLACAGLNPHAGEDGSMGREEIEMIGPALAALRVEGLDIAGPLAPDTMFTAAARARYDAALTMYHDQALIPIKTLAFDEAVNVTLGLPFIRTSPDHGTAFDIAGSGRASPTSLIAALGLAARLSRAPTPAQGIGMTERTLDGLPPLRAVVETFGLDAKRSLGQHFLFDLNLTGRIARLAGPLDGVTVLEIGPGPGGLTRALLAAGAARVIAIERDPRCLPALAEIEARYPGRLQVIEADALTIDPARLAAEAGVERLRVVANLPYNVGTAMLTQWIESEPWPPWFDRLVLMFQREVAERIVAGVEERANYGRLGVLCGWRTQATILFDVPPQAFSPPPKVVSSVVELRPRDNPMPCAGPDLSAVTGAAFGQRRKMLRQSLKALSAGGRPIDVALLLDAAGLEGTRRAEEIDIAGFAALARALAALR